MKPVISYLLLIILIASSCKPYRIVEGTKTEITSRDSTFQIRKDVYIDELINVPIPQFRDTAKVELKVQFKDVNLNIPETESKKGIIGLRIGIKNGVPYGYAFLLDSTILYRYQAKLTIEDSIRIANAITTIKTDKTVILPRERYVPKFYKILLWVNIIIMVVAITYIVFKIKTAKPVNIRNLLNSFK